ncbi:hypothetical protein AX16_001435 [Volvariella volvacea WC 439]|nr:hypothetical protein AX16_001435 [Volvariella volvacea WC 439]
MRAYHIRISLHPKFVANYHHRGAIDQDIPTSLFAPLPSHKAKPTTRQNAIFNAQKNDYRLGPIRIDWTDLEIMSKPTYSSVGPAEATFVPHTSSKSGSTNLPEGVIHIFRDCQSRMDNEDKSGTFPTKESSVTELSSDGVMLAVLAVPSWMTPSDFLGFVAPATDGISHLRIIRDSVPNRSIAVIKFRNPGEASEFAEAYNGRPFNSMEPEICHVVHVLSVEIEASDTVSQAINRLGSTQTNMYELPTCPVCLERMDSAVTGLITVPCSHTFHCMCLSKWGDSRCPVCRYSQNLLSSHPTASSSPRSMPFATPSTPTISTCSSCSSTANLWICLICGNIGCGRYGRAHAHAHYQDTSHLYALELETQRVWDYAGDGYVHRLIQNRADGKLVELPSAATSSANNREGGLGPSQADALTAEKIEAIGIEYSYLLTSQLDSQRAYYEEQTGELRTQLDDLKGLIEKLSKEFEMERRALREHESQVRQEAEQRISEIAKDKQKAEVKAEKMSELARRLEKDLKEERAVSKGLLENLRKVKENDEKRHQEVEASKAKISELEDQVRDLMFFVEVKTKIESGAGLEGEAAGGSLEVSVPQPPPIARKKKTRKG